MTRREFLQTLINVSFAYKEFCLGETKVRSLGELVGRYSFTTPPIETRSPVLTLFAPAVEKTKRPLDTRLSFTGSP